MQLGGSCYIVDGLSVGEKVDCGNVSRCACALLIQSWQADARRKGTFGGSITTKLVSTGCAGGSGLVIFTNPWLFSRGFSLSF